MTTPAAFLALHVAPKPQLQPADTDICHVKYVYKALRDVHPPTGEGSKRRVTSQRNNNVKIFTLLIKQCLI